MIPGSPIHTLWQHVQASSFVHYQLSFARWACGAQGASVLLADDDAQVLVFAHTVGKYASQLVPTDNPADAQTVPLSATVGFNPMAHLYGKTMIMEKAGDPRHNPTIDGILRARTTSLIAIPLVAGHKPVGTFTVVNFHEDTAPPARPGSPDLLSIEDESATKAVAEALGLWLDKLWARIYPNETPLPR